MTRVDRACALVLRRVGGYRVTRQALRHAHRMFPARGAGTQLQRCRFLLRTGWYLQTSGAWFAFLDATPWRRKQVRLTPKLAELLHRPYRRSDLSDEARLVSAVSHWRSLERSGWITSALNFRQTPAVLAKVRCKDGTTMEVVLCALEQFAKEGDACLQLRRGDEVLFTAAFSLGDCSQDARRIVVEVGCLQGPHSKNGRILVRDTTKLLHGLRPRDLMLESLRAVGASVGASALIGVSGQRHIYRHWRKRRQFAFDYDAYWLERKGTRRADGDFSVSVEHPRHERTSVPSKKRAEAKRRRDLEIDLKSSILLALKEPEVPLAKATDLQASPNASHQLSGHDVGHPLDRSLARVFATASPKITLPLP